LIAAWVHVERACRNARHTALGMGGFVVNQQGTGMKQVAHLILVAAGALVTQVPAAVAGPGEREILQEDDAYQPILPDVGGGDGGYRPEWTDPNAGPSENGVNDDPTPFLPSDPVGIPPNED
jgi:hypothetical protein